MDEHLVNVLVQELRLGFSQLSGQIEKTNERLDQTNKRLGQTNERLDQTNERLGQTNERLDETNKRLDEVILREEKTAMSVHLLRSEMNTKLDGIGVYLQSINGSLARHEAQLDDHGARLKRLEE